MATDTHFKRFDDLRTSLQNQKSGDKDLLKHFTQVMTHLVQHCPHDALNKLEEVSWFIKKEDHASLKAFLQTEGAKIYARPSDEETRLETQGAITEGQTLLKVSFYKNNPQVEKKEDDAEPAAIAYVPDL